MAIVLGYVQLVPAISMRVCFNIHMTRELFNLKSMEVVKMMRVTKPLDCRVKPNSVTSVEVLDNFFILNQDRF